ncbi:MAG: hypothetical protein EBY29_12075 [Planctomycetes bacterium]|nr:hypothetical protein [Planctomycetota bacterium]
MEKVAEIRLPLTIVADGTKAVAQLEKFKGQAGSISQKLRGYFQGEASGAVGMLSSYFGIQGAISGLKELYAMGQRVNKLSETYQPDAAKAGAQRDIAQLQNDRRLAKQTAPNAVEDANRATESLQNKTNALPNLASAFSTWVGGVYSIAENNANALTELLRGDTEEDFGQKNLLKISREIATPELPPEVQAQNARMAMPNFTPGDAAAVAANDPIAVQQLEALQEIVRQRRGQR